MIGYLILFAAVGAVFRGAWLGTDKGQELHRRAFRRRFIRLHSPSAEGELPVPSGTHLQVEPLLWVRFELDDGDITLYVCRDTQDGFYERVFLTRLGTYEPIGRAVKRFERERSHWLNAAAKTAWENWETSGYRAKRLSAYWEQESAT